MDLKSIVNSLNLNFSKYKSEYIDNDGNRYYIDNNDNKYISVTTLLKHYENTEFLDNLRISLGEDYVNANWTAAANKGTANHEQIELYAKGKLANFSELKEPFLEARTAIKDFYSKVKILVTEFPLFYNYDNAKVAGRFDSLVYVSPNTFCYKDVCDSEIHYIDEGLYITDLKTKLKLPNINNVKYTFKHSLQGAAYSKILEETYNHFVKGFIIVYVTEKQSKIAIGTNYVLDFYWNCFKSFLLDYYKIQLTQQTWDTMLNYASYHINKYGLVETFSLSEIMYLLT